ncbi:MAG: hypothetical protein VKI63_04200 [Cyanobium sp.]|nr:hypothetical protein [Cyanobium sp.]
MSGFDDFLDDRDLKRQAYEDRAAGQRYFSTYPRTTSIDGAGDFADDDELTEADAQACWALEIQSQVALMNHRNNR